MVDGKKGIAEEGLTVGLSKSLVASDWTCPLPSDVPAWLRSIGVGGERSDGRAADR